MQLLFSFLTPVGFYILCRSEYIFKFDKAFEMHDDIEVLKRMGLLQGAYFILQIFLKEFCTKFTISGLDKGECTPENIERVKSYVPPNLAKYVEGKKTGLKLCEL